MLILSTVRRLMRLRSDAGYTLIELGVAGLVGGIALAVMATFLVSSYKTGVFTQGQSDTINDARIALGKIEKEIRGADSIVWCTPVGKCLEVGAQTALGTFQTVRYRQVGTELQRQVYDAGTSTWGPLSTAIERVENNGSQAVFGCDTQSTLLHVNVNLYIEPTPQSDPNYNVATSVRPRNFSSKASCP